jgi:hypothetical protein
MAREGKPGLSKYKAERLGEIYCLGYSCRDIQKWFPEYPLEVLLWARVHYKWDAVREQYRSVVQQDTLHAALAARMDGVRFLSDLMTATHVHWRKQLLDYIADPENAEAPKFLPKDMYGYQVLINMLKDVTTPGAGQEVRWRRRELATRFGQYLDRRKGRQREPRHPDRHQGRSHQRRRKGQGRVRYVESQ